MEVKKQTRKLKGQEKEQNVSCHGVIPFCCSVRPPPGGPLVYDRCVIVTEEGSGGRGANVGFTKGGQEYGETSVNNGVRELREESGIKWQQIYLLFRKSEEKEEPVYVDEINDKGRICVRYYIAVFRDEKEAVEHKFVSENPKEHAKWMNVVEACAAFPSGLQRRAIVLSKAHDIVRSASPDYIWKEVKEEPLIPRHQSSSKQNMSKEERRQKYAQKVMEKLRQADKVEDTTSKEDTKISKCLTTVLRHRAEDFKLEVAKDAYVRLDHLLARVTALHGVTEDQIRHVVKTNDKQRFSLVDRADQHGVVRTYIRANQGHGANMKQLIDESLLLKKLEKPLLICIHGTTIKAWRTIQKDGLRTMSRTHIHFTTSDDLSQVKSGFRASSNVLIYINMAKAMADGIEFFESENGVILTKGKDGFLSKDYFEKVVFR